MDRILIRFSGKQKNKKRMIREIYEKLNMDFYEHLLLDSLTTVYSALEKSSQEKKQQYSFLLIDKFAIHSSSFFHLSKGVVEHGISGEKRQAFGYDLFTVNSTYRTILETYATYHHIYVEPKTEEEKEFRFLLWKIDGLKEKLKYQINPTDFKEAESILEFDKTVYTNTIDEIEKSKFYNTITSTEIEKVYNPNRKKFCWKFLHESGRLKPMTIMSLIEHTCKTRGFINSHRHASTHTHSSYLSIEEFEKYRGKPMPEFYTEPLIKCAIFITSMFILDICDTNESAKKAFSILPKPMQDFIIGITKSIKNE